MGPLGPCPGRGGFERDWATDPPLSPPFQELSNQTLYINICIHTDRREDASDARRIRRDSAAIFVYSEEDEGAYAVPPPGSPKRRINQETGTRRQMRDAGCGNAGYGGRIR